MGKMGTTSLQINYIWNVLKDYGRYYSALNFLLVKMLHKLYLWHLKKMPINAVCFHFRPKSGYVCHYRLSTQIYRANHRKYVTKVLCNWISLCTASANMSN